MAVSAKRENTLAARRSDLVQGTIRSIATLGYNNSTVQTICEAANVSRGLIGHYFESKDALLIEAFRHLCERQDIEMREAVHAAGDDPLDRLLAATVMTFKSAAGRDIALVWMSLCGVAPWNPAMMDLHRQLYRRYRSWIERLMMRAARARGIGLDARRAAITYAQMVDGFWMGWLMDSEAYSLDEATEIVSDWVLHLFDEPRKMKPAAAAKRHPKGLKPTKPEM